MTKQNILDRAISWLSPERGLKRSLARARSGVISPRQAYDGASTGRRTDGWRVVGTSADAEASVGGARLRDVARDMVRNNPHAWRLRQSITVNTVGTGIIPSVESADEAARTSIERLLVDHFDSTACDATGRHDVYGLQSLAMGTIVESGEVLIRLRPRLASDGLPLPFQMQVLEPDYLDSSIDGILPGGNRAIRGIEFNKIGQRVAYWLFSEHPGSISSYSLPTSHRVPAERVLHIFRVDRPDQHRGVSWFAPVVMRLRDYADAADAHLVRQKISACFTAFITSVDDSDADGEGPYTYPLEEIGPGMIERLRPGDDVRFGSPPQVDGFAEYARSVLREIAAGMGVSYEALTGDLTGVNFSSGRMGWLEYQRSIDGWRNHMLVPQMLAPIGAWFLDAVAAQTGSRSDARIKWTPPRREMIDPTKEIIAARTAIRAGLSSRSYELRRLGFDPDVLDQEIAADNDRADALDLTLDSDPRRMSQAGQVQQEPAGE